MGFEDAKAGRMPTEAEHAEMARLLNEAMDAGACGWSAQRLGRPAAGGRQRRQRADDFDGTPMPTDVMYPETRMALAKVLGERGEGFIELSDGGRRRRPAWEAMAARRAARRSCGRPCRRPATRWAPGSVATCSPG